ncbi:unnamed protein product, partial [Mesorhabditis belari]|uniref:Uncharacterized protein n=1 Tax=Mesorhabditis belari TaxID=2138241 RepID=A0AAF3EKK0_9BILA
MSLPELVLVIVILIGLTALYIGVMQFYYIDFVLPTDPLGISDDLYYELSAIISTSTTTVLLLSLVSTPIACLCSATNNRLALPIRLLITAENANKLVYAIFYAAQLFCGSVDAWGPGPTGRCSDEITGTFYDGYFLLSGTYKLMDIAQYCQMLVSLSRFLAVSFDGQYFGYTLKWPLVQMRRAGHSPSRAESLLMIQMVTNSSFILTNTIVVYFLQKIISLYFDWKIYYTYSNFQQQFLAAFLFNLMASVICILFLVKRKEKTSQKTTIVTVVSSSFTQER